MNAAILARHIIAINDGNSF